MLLLKTQGSNRYITLDVFVPSMQWHLCLNDLVNISSHLEYKCNINSCLVHYKCCTCGLCWCTYISFEQIVTKNYCQIPCVKSFQFHIFQIVYLIKANEEVVIITYFITRTNWLHLQPFSFKVLHKKCYWHLEMRYTSNFTTVTTIDNKQKQGYHLWSRNILYLHQNRRINETSTLLMSKVSGRID
jgi:hypothetical protein